jgi:hypothetical protein
MVMNSIRVSLAIYIEDDGLTRRLIRLKLVHNGLYLVGPIHDTGIGSRTGMCRSYFYRYRYVPCLLYV